MSQQPPNNDPFVPPPPPTPGNPMYPPNVLAAKAALAASDAKNALILRLVDYAGNYEPLRDVRLDPPATARKQLARQKELLLRDYGVAASRIKTIDGGYRKRRSMEYWIVSDGEPLPRPSPNSFPLKRTRGK